MRETGEKPRRCNEVEGFRNLSKTRKRKNSEIEKRRVCYSFGKKKKKALI